MAAWVRPVLPWYRMGMGGFPPAHAGGSPDVLADLASDDPDRRVRALANASFEPSVEPAVIAALGDADVRVREAAVRTLAAWGRPSAIRPLVRASLRDTSARVRAQAVTALGDLMQRRLRGT